MLKFLSWRVGTTAAPKCAAGVVFAIGPLPGDGRVRGVGEFVQQSEGVSGLFSFVRSGCMDASHLSMFSLGCVVSEGAADETRSHPKRRRACHTTRRSGSG